MRYGQRSILALIAVAVNGCSLIGIDRIPPEISRFPSLAGKFADRFPVGAAVEPEQLESAEAPLLMWHFNSVVAENAMKPPRVQPSEGRFDFSRADRIVAFAERRGMKVRGHTLLWHEETPQWYWQAANGAPASGDQVLERLRNHIHALVGRYRGRIYAWDVVNEVIDYTRPDCLRDDLWRRVVGARYVEQAFRYAHEADPAAKLFINDYDTAEPRKRACLERVARELLARGVPLHGVGHQMHVDLDKPSAADVDETLARFAALGLENQVTELDLTLGADAAPVAKDALARQAARYEELFAVFARHPDVTAVTFWGISDAHTWRNAGRAPGTDQPLLFDVGQRPKPAYFAVAREAPP
jgi:endo-1,4-beta-xylanase